MQFVRLTNVLLIGLALMNNGCSSLTPLAANFPPAPPEDSQQQINTDGDNLGLELLYGILCWGCSALANK
jgi:hypothetical protein